MKSKKIIVTILVLLLVACAAVLTILFLKKKESYRIIKVYEYEGEGVVNRDSTGDIEPYTNMVLESGDNVKLNSGLMNLKLDDDKYVYVEEQTEFTLVATGTKENSKTSIELKSGAITNDIQKKLNGESSYEINTPNVTISVRGTNYRVNVYEDSKGATCSRISVFDGTVVTKLINADGTISDEEVTVDSGYEVIVFTDDNTTDYQGDVQEIDYSTLPQSVGGTLEEGQSDADIKEDTTEDANSEENEQVEADLTAEEIDSLTIFAKYVTSTQAPAAESIENMTLQMSDEVVMTMIGTLANDAMGYNDEADSLKTYVVSGTHDAGYMSVSKEDIDTYVANVFDYTGIVYYEQGNVMAGANGYEIWEHQGFCDTTITINETYMEGENYVIKGVANLNYSDIFDPMFMDAEFTFTVRRNPDSPFGFTYVDLVFGKVTKY
ncbi:MAG: FecR domain-containing protein [Lachnospiraceae bacterium]|nr:FecR domain-containing protein [Lachnospiraceae bacterium]